MLKTRPSRWGLATPFLIAAALSFTVIASADVFQQYSGLLSTDTSGLNSGGLWSHSAKITWEVDNNSLDFTTWHYAYTFTVLNGTGDAIKFLNLETSSSFTPADLLSLQWGGGLSIGVMDSNLNSPSMPQNLYGMQFTSDGNAYTRWAFAFDTPRSPVWGDFYARGPSDNWAYNKGFKRPLADPSIADFPLQNGSALNCLLVPDTNEPVGRVGAIKVIKFNDYDREGTARNDPNFGLADWWIHADSASGSAFPQQTGTDGSALFAPLNGEFPWTISEANVPAGWQFVEALLYNHDTGAFLGRVTDPNLILADISNADMDVFLGNVFVPEPATLTLLGAGCMVVALRARRRRVRTGQ